MGACCGPAVCVTGFTCNYTATPPQGLKASSYFSTTLTAANCCENQCGYLACPTGSGPKYGKACTTCDATDCCGPLNCASATCPAGRVHDTSKDTVACTGYGGTYCLTTPGGADEACCMAGPNDCSVYDCTNPNHGIDYSKEAHLCAGATCTDAECGCDAWCYTAATFCIAAGGYIKDTTTYSAKCTTPSGCVSPTPGSCCAPASTTGAATTGAGTTGAGTTAAGTTAAGTTAAGTTAAGTTAAGTTTAGTTTAGTTTAGTTTAGTTAASSTTAKATTGTPSGASTVVVSLSAIVVVVVAMF